MNGGEKIYQSISSTLISSTNVFQQDCLKYEIMKILGRKCFCHFQGGNYEFKIAVWNEYRKIFKKYLKMLCHET